MHFANEVVLDLGKFLDSLRHVVQFLQHHFLARRQPMHPPKANAPAAGPEPGENDRDCHVVCRGDLKIVVIQLIG